MAQKYTVRRGDTLFGIAKKCYGDGARFRLITEANNIREPFQIFPGQVLTIPDLPGSAPPPPATPPEVLR